MESQGILYVVRDHIAWIILNRLDVLNTFDEELARSGDDVWVVLVTGTGSSLCAGQDLRFSVDQKPKDRKALAVVEHGSYGGLNTAKTEGLVEGRNAFLERRSPHWTGH